MLSGAHSISSPVMMAPSADYPSKAPFEASPTGQLQFKRHKTLPRPRSERASELPIRVASPSTRYGLVVDTSRSSNGKQPSSPRTLKHQSRRISSGPDLPPTPPRHSRQPSDKSSGKTSSPAATDIALRTPQPSHLRSPSTPPNQKSPPTPDVTPPHHSTSRPKLLRPVAGDRAGSNTTIGESQSGSFTTAREDPISSEDEGKSANTKNSRPNVRHVSDTSNRIPRPDALASALANFAPRSEGSSVSRSLGGDWGHNDSDWGSVSEVEQEWDHNLQRMVTVKKRPEPLEVMRSSPARRAKLIESNTVTSTQAAKAVRGMPLHQRAEVLSTRALSTRDAPSSVASSTITSSDPRRMSVASNKSTVSTVVEAYLLDTTPKRQRTLRHVRKQTLLREPTNASSVSTTDSLKSERLQNDARMRTRPSAPKSESQSSNVTTNSISSSRARREIRKTGAIPVVVVPDRLSSHKTKSREPSLRSRSSRRSSQTTTVTSVSSTVNDSSSRRSEPPIVRRPVRGRSYSASESSDERTMDYPPVIPARSSSLSAPTSRNGSRASSLTAESMKLHNALQEYLNKKKDTQEVPDIRFSQAAQTTQTLSSPSQSRRLSSSEHHDEFLNTKGYGSRNTPFSQASVDTNGTNPVVSEAQAVQMYPHQNSSLLMVDHSVKPSESTDQTQSEAEEDLDVQLSTDSSEEIPNTPQPNLSLADVDSPLRNPRAPPEPPSHPPFINFIPATPSGTTPAHEKMALMGNYFEAMNEKPPRRPSVVRRAFNRTRRHSVDYTPPSRRPSSFLSRTLSLSRTGRIKGMPTMEIEPEYPSPDDSPVEEDKLHPFWRPQWSSDDLYECDGDCDDDCDIHWPAEPADEVYRYPPVDNRPKGPQRSFSSRVKRTFAVLPSREDSHYTSYDWPTTERRTIGRTASGNLRVMRHRSSFDSLRRNYNDDERPHSADGDVKKSFWRANSVHRRAAKEKRRLSLGSKLEELQNLPRRFSEKRREKRSQELRKKISGPKEVRDGVGEVIRSSTARDHYQSYESIVSR